MVSNVDWTTTLKLEDFESVPYLFLIAATIFLIPSNLFLKFGVNTAYVHGLLVDYLLPKFSASDIPIVLLFVLWAKEILRKKKWQKLKKPSLETAVLAGCIAFLFGRQFFTEKPFAAVWFFIKLTEIVFFVIFLVTHRKLLQSKIIHWTLYATLLFQSLLAIFQFHTQHSLFPNYIFLGEPNLSHPLFLAKASFGGVEKILPYGTTAHPNILAGFLALGVILFLQKNRSPKFFFLCTPIFYALYLTQSLSAWLSLLIGLTILFCFPKKIPHILQKIFLPIFLFVLFFATPFFIHIFAQKYPDDPSLTRRDELNQAAISMIVVNPIVGVGLNNFTAQLENYHPTQEILRFVQPAHNVGLLSLAETGLLGVIIVYLVIKKQKLSIRLLLSMTVVLPIACLDHYLLTEQTGLLLATIFFLQFMKD